MESRTRSIYGRRIFIMIIVLIIVVVGGVAAIVYYLRQDDTSDTNTNTANVNEVVNTNEERVTLDTATIAESVVNVYCPINDGESTFDTASGYYGSGVIFTDDGLIFTNSHVIPQDELYVNVFDEGCIITMPDPDTGFPNEMYYADPIVIPGPSDDYDIAFLEIYDVYTDAEGVVWGDYPRVFPDFDDSEVDCSSEYITLGEPVRVFGYPGSSGGYSLTVTEGVVSTFTEDGMIVTSAKIDEGNSGGLAVDQDGCALGIPTAVSLGAYENMGLIISVDLMLEFLDEVDAYLAE